MMVCLASLCTVFSLPSYSQFLPDLQAKSPAEYDAYLDVLDGPATENGEAFTRAYPQSALSLPVYEILAKAWRAQGDAGQAISAANRGLAIAPDYAPLLVELADLLCNSGGPLDRAESSARRALEILARAKAPVRIPPGVWTAAVGGLRARAHAAIGMVRFKQNDTPGAVKEFEASLAESPSAGPALHYRLGRLYALTGRAAEARTHLDEAAKSTDPDLRSLAAAALASLPPTAASTRP